MALQTGYFGLVYGEFGQVWTSLTKFLSKERKTMKTREERNARARYLRYIHSRAFHVATRMLRTGKSAEECCSPTVYTKHREEIIVDAKKMLHAYYPDEY